jgi:hypothetical protein
VEEPTWTLTDEQVQEQLWSALAAQASLEELTARLVRSVSDGRYRDWRELRRRAPG